MTSVGMRAGAVIAVILLAISFAFLGNVHLVHADGTSNGPVVGTIKGPISGQAIIPGVGLT